MPALICLGVCSFVLPLEKGKKKAAPLAGTCVPKGKTGLWRGTYRENRAESLL